MVLRALTISIAAVILYGTPAVALGQDSVTAGTDTVDLSAAIAAAIAQQPAPPQPTPRHTGVKALFKQLVVDFKSLPAKENIYWAAAGGALAASLHPVDDNVNQAFLDASSGVKNFFKPGAVLGQLPGVAATTIYVVGRANDKPHVSHVGMDLIRAVIVSQAMVQTIKCTQLDASGRTAAPGTPFPPATRQTRSHLPRRSSATCTGSTACPGTVFSSYVAMSRLPANRHWLSDVAFGSAVGIIAGRTVTGHELNKLQRTDCAGSRRRAGDLRSGKSPMTERRKMLAGELYDPFDRRARGRSRSRPRSVPGRSTPPRGRRRRSRRGILTRPVRQGRGIGLDAAAVLLRLRLNIELGERVFFNFNCVVLDVCRVTIGDYTLFGPAVQIYTADAPDERRAAAARGVRQADRDRLRRLGRRRRDHPARASASAPARSSAPAASSRAMSRMASSPRATRAESSARSRNYTPRAGPGLPGTLETKSLSPQTTWRNSLSISSDERSSPNMKLPRSGR